EVAASAKGHNPSIVSLVQLTLAVSDLAVPETSQSELILEFRMSFPCKLGLTVPEIFWEILAVRYCEGQLYFPPYNICMLCRRQPAGATKLLHACMFLGG